MKKRTNLTNWLVIIVFLLVMQLGMGPQVWAGSVVGWGVISPETSNSVLIAAGAAGSGPSLALTADGSIVAWGGNYSPPSGNDFVAVSAGGGHSLALRADGSIAGWGDNYAGQVTPPFGNDFVSISAGADHSLAIKADGSIVAWGDNKYGQATPPPGNDFVALDRRHHRRMGTQ
jgi:alpha-tubulin suppressor-like RCC1 family protein